MSGHSAFTKIGEPVVLESLGAGLTIVAARALGDPEDAADAVQETLTRALAAVRGNRIPPDVPLVAFVHGIARHVIADIFRRRAREGASNDCEGLVATSPSLLESLVLKEEQARVMRALARLPDEDRLLLRRCYVHGERIVEIAASRGEPAERVRKRKSRALARLREELQVSESGHVSDKDSTDRA